ncbi:hypothetical protein MAP00_008897 [Monascus purpureus]|nr:hypothetical protein MAP00_008897 [Monascus purpureus]
MALNQAPLPANSLKSSIPISTFVMSYFHPRQVRVGTVKDQPDQHIPMNVVKPTNPLCILDICPVYSALLQGREEINKIEMSEQQVTPTTTNPNLSRRINPGREIEKP